MAAAAAYDLRVLAEQAHERGADRATTAAIVDDLLDTVHRALAKHSPAHTQLYKTVAALGSFFFVRGDRGLAGRLRDELNGLTPERHWIRFVAS